MNTDRFQLAELGRKMEKQKVYTLQVRRGNQAYGTFISQNLEEVLSRYAEELKKAIDNGLYVEHGITKPRDFGRTALQCFVSRDVTLLTEWSVLVEET